MYLFFLLFFSCYGLKNVPLQKEKGARFVIDWEINPYEHSNHPSFVDLVCNDINKKGLLQGNKCKFFVLLEKKHISKLKYAWDKCSKIIIKQGDVLPELLEKLIYLFYLTDNKYCYTLINELFATLKGDDNLFLNCFEKAVIWNNFELADRVLKTKKRFSFNLEFISNPNKFNRDRIEKSLHFLIERNIIVDKKELTKALQIATKLRNLDIATRLIDTIYEKQFLIVALSNCVFLTKDDQYYNRNLINKIFSLFGVGKKEDFIKLIKESKFVSLASNEILAYSIVKMYSILKKDISKFISDIDIFSFRGGKTQTAEFIEIIRGTHSSYSESIKNLKELKEVLNTSFKELLINTEDLLRKAYIYLDLSQFIKIINFLYQNEDDEFSILDKVNYINKEGKSSLFIGYEESKKSRSERIATILLGYSSCGVDVKLNEILKSNSSKLIGFKFENKTYQEYNGEEKSDSLEFYDIGYYFSYLREKEKINMELEKLSRLLCDEYSERREALLERKKEIEQRLLEIEEKNVNRSLGDKDLLEIAAHQGYSEIVLHLVQEKSLDINGNQEGSESALILASKKGNIEIVDILLKSGADVDFEFKNKRTALIFAAENGHKKIVKMLLEAGANLEQKIKNGCNALILSVKNGHKEVVELLLEEGIDINSTNNRGVTALMVAIKKGNREIADLLSKNENYLGNSTELILASSYGYFSIVENLLSKSEVINSVLKDNFKEEALTYALFNSHLKIVNLLLENGADINLFDAEGKTILDKVLDRKRIDLASFLIENKATFSYLSENGFGALLLSFLEEGYENSALILIENRDDFNYEYDFGGKAIVMSLIRGYKNMVNLLIEKKAPLNVKSKNGMTLLAIATEKGYLEIAELLIKNGVYVDTPSYCNEKLFIRSDFSSRKEIVKILIKNGTKLDVKDYFGEKALVKAVRQGDKYIVELIIKTKNSGLTSFDYKEALDMAISMNLDEISKLLKENVDERTTKAYSNSFISERDQWLKFADKEENGWTPLMIASQKGHVELVKLLLENGADPNLKSKLKETALIKALYIDIPRTDNDSSLK